MGAWYQIVDLVVLEVLMLGALADCAGVAKGFETERALRAGVSHWEG
jgi:hypothetical protein